MDEQTRKRLTQLQHQALMAKLRAEDAWDRLEQSQQRYHAGVDLLRELALRLREKQCGGDESSWREENAARQLHHRTPRTNGR